MDEATRKRRNDKMYAKKITEAETRAKTFEDNAKQAKIDGKDNSAYIAGYKANKARADAFRAGGTPKPSKPKVKDRPKTPKDFPTPRTLPKDFKPDPRVTTWAKPGGGRGGPPKISEKDKKRPSDKSTWEKSRADFNTPAAKSKREEAMKKYIKANQMLT